MASGTIAKPVKFINAPFEIAYTLGANGATTLNIPAENLPGYERFALVDIWTGSSDVLIRAFNQGAVGLRNISNSQVTAKITGTVKYIST